MLYRCDYGLRDWEKATDEGKQAYYDDADVLIRELGMTRESTIVYYPDEGVHERPHRYVTSWEPE